MSQDPIIRPIDSKPIRYIKVDSREPGDDSIRGAVQWQKRKGKGRTIVFSK